MSLRCICGRPGISERRKEQQSGGREAGFGCLEVRSHTFPRGLCSVSQQGSRDPPSAMAGGGRNYSGGKTRQAGWTDFKDAHGLHCIDWICFQSF